MKIEKIVKGSFTVIGKEGSTADGDDFIEKLWADANAHFDQISHLAKKDENGNPAGVWGAMSDFTHSFLRERRGEYFSTDDTVYGGAQRFACRRGS